MKKTGNLSREELSRLAKRLGKKKSSADATRPAHSKRREAPRATQAALGRVERVHPDGSTRDLPLSSPRRDSGSWTAWSPAAPGTTWRWRSA